MRGRGAWGPAALHEDDPEGVIQKYEVMRKPGAEKAIVLLKEVGQSVKTLIQLRGWRTSMELTLRAPCAQRILPPQFESSRPKL